jgi:hypothetical protein
MASERDMLQLSLQGKNYFGVVKWLNESFVQQLSSAG